MALCISAYVHRETDLGIRLTIYDEKIRYVIIPLLIIGSLASIAGYGPFNAGPGQYWFSIKMLLYSGALMIGLKLRFVMREWTEMFRILAEGANAAVETKLEKSLAFAKRLAYFYWVLIATVGFFGATHADLSTRAAAARGRTSRSSRGARLGAGRRGRARDDGCVN